MYETYKSNLIDLETNNLHHLQAFHVLFCDCLVIGISSNSTALMLLTKVDQFGSIYSQYGWI